MRLEIRDVKALELVRVDPTREALAAVRFVRFVLLDGDTLDAYGRAARGLVGA